MKVQGRYTLKGRYGVWTITDTKTGSKSNYSDKPFALSEIQSLLTNLRHHAQSRKRPRASVAPTGKQALTPGGESGL